MSMYIYKKEDYFDRNALVARESKPECKEGTYKGFDYFYERGSFKCPALSLYGFAYESNLKRAISKALKTRLVR